QRISALESTIADRREFYNDMVNLYNIPIEQIPMLWVAQEFGYKARPLLTVAPSDGKDMPLAFAKPMPVAA
ncbi:MAG: LemA family protein, partial [Nitrospira sp.]|nr:LemA family protein [Nitrospira sp.]